MSTSLDYDFHIACVREDREVVLRDIGGTARMAPIMSSVARRGGWARYYGGGTAQGEGLRRLYLGDHCGGVVFIEFYLRFKSVLCPTNLGSEKPTNSK